MFFFFCFHFFFFTHSQNTLIYNSFKNKRTKQNKQSTDGSDDIDGASFDAEKYAAELVRTLPLRQLLSRKSMLEAEMKQLDSDMKTLVYENYAKFITATDTIRTMKTSVGTMEEDVRALTETMGAACGTADRIDAALREKRERLVHLSHVAQLLNKLKFVVDLPARLRTAVQMGAYAEAVRDYKRAEALVDRHRDLPSFNGIRTECRAVMDDLRTALRARIDSLAAAVPVPAAAPADGVFADATAHFAFPELCEVLKQLLELGDSPEAVCALYTDCVANLFVALFAAAAAVPFIATDDEEDYKKKVKEKEKTEEKKEEEEEETQDGKETEQEREEQQPIENKGGLTKSQKASANITKFSLSFSVLMLRVFENFRDVFVPESIDADAAFRSADVPESVPAVVPCWRQFERYLADVVELFFSVLLRKCCGAPCDLLEARRLFSDADTGGTTGGAFARIAPVLGRVPVAQTDGVTVEQLICASEAAQMPLRQLGRQVCFLRIADKAHELTTFALLALVEAQFSRLCTRVEDDFTHLRDSCASADVQHDSNNSDNKSEVFWSSVCDNALKLVTAALEALLDALRPLNSSRVRVKCGPKEAATTFQRVHVKAQQFFLFVETVLLQYLRIEDSDDDDEKDSTSATTATATATATTGPAEAARAHPVVLLALGGAARSIGDSLKLFVHKIEQAFPLDDGVQLILVGDLRRRFRELAQRLLARYVVLESARLGAPLRTYLETAQWLRTREPRYVGDGPHALAHALAHTSAVVRSFFANACFAVAANALSLSSSSSASGTTMTSTASISSIAPSTASSSSSLAECAVCGAPVEFAADSVRAALARACAMDVRECVRLGTFSRSGFQQLQVDLRYLRGVLGGFAGAAAAEAVLERAERDARERCNDPTPLDTTVIEHILKLSEAAHPHA